MNILYDPVITAILSIASLVFLAVILSYIIDLFKENRK